MILIDYSPALMAAAHSSWKYHQKSNEVTPFVNFCEAGILNKLRTTVSKGRSLSTPEDEVVVAIDSRPYWRSKYFPNYKKNRKPLKEKYDVPWDDVYEISDHITQAIREVFGWKIVEIPTVEADDIIAVLSRYSSEPVIIMSRDGDFKQLHTDRVRQYDNIGQKFIKENDPINFLNAKIIAGDAKDGVPNILSDLNAIMTEGVKQTPMRKAKLAKWSQMDPKEFCDASMYRRYRQNKALLDLSQVPPDLQEAIVSVYNEPVETGNIYNWLSSRGHAGLITYIKDFS